MKKRPAKKKMSDAALAAYYDSQSEDQLVGEIESKRWTPSRLKIKRTGTCTTRLHLTSETIDLVKALAVAKGIDYERLISMWIEERARAEMAIP